jgi:hypothetical protein
MLDAGWKNALDLQKAVGHGEPDISQELLAAG